MKKAKKTMKWGQDTGSGAEPQPGGGGGAWWGRWYISSAYQCLHLLVIINKYTKRYIYLLNVLLVYIYICLDVLLVACVAISLPNWTRAAGVIAHKTMPGPTAANIYTYIFIVIYIYIYIVTYNIWDHIYIYSDPSDHWENYISISFHIEWDMIVVTVFLLIFWTKWKSI